MQEIVTTEAAALVLWPPDLKNWLTGKDADVGKDWRQKEKGTAENKIVRWHHQLNRQEFEQTLGDSEGQRIVRWHHQLKDKKLSKHWAIVKDREQWDGITNSIDKNLSKHWEIVKDREGWWAIVYGVTKSQTQLSDWTTTAALCLPFWPKYKTQSTWNIFFAYN